MLTRTQAHARKILILVAQGHFETHKPGYISYKELWRALSNEAWGQNRTRDVVDCIINISAHEVAEGRPPLNELVVRTNRWEPTEPWLSIRRSLKRRSEVLAPYRSHRDAQEACWQYWNSQNPGSSPSRRTQTTDESVEEGLKQDRTITFRTRNKRLIQKRKVQDDNTCQACGFKLRIAGTHIIDCHHINPLALKDAVSVTRIEDLVCLCPTCHRVAHAERYPLSVKQIKAVIAGREAADGSHAARTARR